MDLLVSLPAWMVERLKDRAIALGVSLDVAVEMSLEMDRDRQANVLGWAVARGMSPAEVAESMHYSETTVRAAHKRYVAARLPRVGGTP